jgi:hypothetical protein
VTVANGDVGGDLIVRGNKRGDLDSGVFGLAKFDTRDVHAHDGDTVLPAKHERKNNKPATMEAPYDADEPRPAPAGNSVVTRSFKAVLLIINIKSEDICRICSNSSVVDERTKH